MGIQRLWRGAATGLLVTLLPVAVVPSAQATDVSGRVFVWGIQDSDEARVPPAARFGVVEVAAGSGHTLALKSDGSVVAWGGANDYGQRTLPSTVQSGVVQVAAGGKDSLALKGDGSVVAWGYNAWGQTDVPAAAHSGVTQVAAGGRHSLALKSDGSVVAWGSDQDGQTTVPDAAQSGVVQVAAGFNHSLALKSDGSVVAWGSDHDGQTTVPEAAQSGVVQVAAGWEHSLALKSDGSVVAWGANWDGQATVPEAAQSGVVQVAAGWNHSLALKSDGTIVAWGSDTQGQTTVPSEAQAGVIQIAAGETHSVAVVGGDFVEEAVVAFTPNKYGENTAEVQENAGTVNLTMTRAGNTAIPASVDYAVTGGTATAGEDFILAPGTLTFAAGETTATIPVDVTNDTAAELDESIYVTLTPGDGVALGDPAWMEVLILPSDQRPDATISTAPASGYVGNDVYNTTGGGQTKTLSAPRTTTRTFYVRIAHDGTGSFDMKGIVVRGAAAPAGSTVRYFQGGTEITKAMLSNAGWSVSLDGHDSVTIAMRIKILSGAVIGSLKPGVVRASWTSDGTRTDLVKGVVKVTR